MDLWTLRSEIRDSEFNGGFSLLAVRQSELFFVPSLLGFGLVGKSELCCILHQLPILQIPFLCV